MSDKRRASDCSCFLVYPEPAAESDKIGAVRSRDRSRVRRPGLRKDGQTG